MLWILECAVALSTTSSDIRVKRQMSYFTVSNINSPHNPRCGTDTFWQFDMIAHYNLFVLYGVVAYWKAPSNYMKQLYCFVNYNQGTKLLCSWIQNKNSLSLKCIWVCCLTIVILIRTQYIKWRHVPAQVNFSKRQHGRSQWKRAKLILMSGHVLVITSQRMIKR